MIRTFFFIALVLSGCHSSQHDSERQEQATVEVLQLTLEEANRLVPLPLDCISTEYPNKLGQVIGSEKDLASPMALHPAFYGCFDWHSAVHGHWSLVRILRMFPEIEERERIIHTLQRHLTPEAIRGEVNYFTGELNGSYERMYGWAWLLKLVVEIKKSELAEVQELGNNLQPLTAVIVKKTKEFLPKLVYPIRVGTHTNTAFALSMIYDYAELFNDQELVDLIEQRAMAFYGEDSVCPLEWEPSGYDFLSPCLEEANLIRKVMPKEEFKGWLTDFLPQLGQKDFHLAPGVVSDRTDGHLVHLDGLNFSRAWCLIGIANTLPEYNYLKEWANEHISYSLPSIVDGNYEGGHWLASFALLSLSVEE